MFIICCNFDKAKEEILVKIIRQLQNHVCKKKQRKQRKPDFLGLDRNDKRTRSN